MRNNLPVTGLWYGKQSEVQCYGSSPAAWPSQHYCYTGQDRAHQSKDKLTLEFRAAEVL